MKKINTIIFSILMLVSFSSCDRFLELKPRNQKVVKTVEDYRDILASFMYYIKTPNPESVKIMGLPNASPFISNNMNMELSVFTGESNLNKGSELVFDKDKAEFKTQALNMYLWMDNVFYSSYIWKSFYQFLGGTNKIIDGVSQAEGNDDRLRNIVKGEALVWRAYGYYKLLQHYSPYQNNEYGIPLYLTPEKDAGTAMPKRNTQQEVFKLILGDCQSALELLEVTPTSEWNCAYRSDFIHAMMASIYTWKAMSASAENTDWANAEKNATIAMGKRQLTNSAETLRKMFDCSHVTAETSMKNDEFYFRMMFGKNNYSQDLSSAYYKVSVAMVNQEASPEYIEKFRESDIRKSAYFSPDGLVNDKYSLDQYKKGGCVILFRLAEMYLIKAEALVRQGKIEEGRQVLREFQQSRYTETIEIPGDADALLQEILDERLREFYTELDFRWLDMKRLGVTITRYNKGERNTLEPYDFRYTLPIPPEELKTNKNIRQNPGWDNIVLI